MYDMIVTVNRSVIERYKIKVSADDPEEAQDIAYDYFSAYPDGTVPPDSCLKIMDDTFSCSVEAIEFVETETPEVFNDDSA